MLDYVQCLVLVCFICVRMQPLPHRQVPLKGKQKALHAKCNAFFILLPSVKGGQARGVAY